MNAKLRVKMVAPLVYEECQFLVSDLCRILPTQNCHWIREHLKDSIVTDEQVPRGGTTLLPGPTGTAEAVTRSRIASEPNHRLPYLINEPREKRQEGDPIAITNIEDCSCVVMGMEPCLSQEEQV